MTGPSRSNQLRVRQLLQQRSIFSRRHSRGQPPHDRGQRASATQLLKKIRARYNGRHERTRLEEISDCLVVTGHERGDESLLPTVAEQGHGLQWATAASSTMHSSKQCIITFLATSTTPVLYISNQRAKATQQQSPTKAAPRREHAPQSPSSSSGHFMTAGLKKYLAYL